MKNPATAAKDMASDQPFTAATFGNNNSRPVSYADDEDADLPSNLLNSRSNVPGMTPQELLQAHRQSLADHSRGTGDSEFHSLTLSRHQVERDAMQPSEHLGEPDLHAALDSFQFGDDKPDFDGLIDAATPVN